MDFDILNGIYSESKSIKQTYMLVIIVLLQRTKNVVKKLLNLNGIFICKTLIKFNLN